MNIGFIDMTNNIPQLIIATGAEIYKDNYGGKGYRQYFDSDPVYVVLKDCGDYYMVRHHSLAEGITGFFKKSDVHLYQD